MYSCILLYVIGYYCILLYITVYDYIYTYIYVARGGVYKGRDPASPNPSGFPTRGVTTPQKAQPAPCAYG
jgi:hypothetical protein